VITARSGRQAARARRLYDLAHAGALDLDEQDEDQITANYLRREPSGPQRDRARVSALVSAELARRARHCGVPVVPARPWGDGLDRVDKALRQI
jgi:hypothetical protein